MADTLSLTSLSTSDLAQILFASPLQASDAPTPDRIRTVIGERLCACGGDHTPCAAYVAQEAGDHPETYAARMRWALSTVERAFPTYVTAA